jgi:hypothetical protein
MSPSSSRAVAAGPTPADLIRNAEVSVRLGNVADALETPTLCITIAGLRTCETDCVAGHVGLELRNVDAKYPFERSHRFAGIQPNSGFGDYSRLSCGVGGYAARATRESAAAWDDPAVLRPRQQEKLARGGDNDEEHAMSHRVIPNRRLRYRGLQRIITEEIDRRQATPVCPTCMPEAGGFEPLHCRIEIREDSQPGAAGFEHTHLN